MKTIKLTNVDDITIVDDSDYNKAIQYSWFLKKSAYCSYVAASIRNGDKVKTLRLHRLIMNCKNKCFDVHHKNHNPLDNRRENLEIILAKIHRGNKRYAS